MKLAILTSRFPFPLEKGDKLRIFHHIKQLSRFYSIYLFALVDEIVKEEDLKQVSPFCCEIRIYKIPVWKRILNLTWTLFNKFPFQVSYFYDLRTKKKIHKDILNLDPDHIYCQLIRMAPYVLELHYSKTLDFMDSSTLNFRNRFSRITFFSKLEYDLLALFEQKLMSFFDEKVIISDRDAEELDTDRYHPLQVIQNGVDTKYYHVNPESKKEFDLAFCGNLGYHHNQKAVGYLLDHIMPLLPESSLVVAGARAPGDILRKGRSRNVVVKAWVEDLRTIYWSARIFVAPIFSGSGQQNKILEAMALGIPCITTSFVNEAIHAQDKVHLYCANSPEEFRKYIESLENDKELYEEMVTNARKFVEQKFTWESNSQKLVEIIGKYSRDVSN